MSRRVLFDSSVYIQALRERRVELIQSRTYDGALVHLSTVVACELFAGAKNPRSRRELERLWRDFDRAGRLVVPIADGVELLERGLRVVCVGHPCDRSEAAMEQTVTAEGC